MAEENAVHKEGNKERIHLKPVWWLLLVGLILVGFPFFLFRGEAVAQAAMVALGMTICLYGLYPSPGVASGAIGPIKAFGPAAIGLYLFFAIWKGLWATPQDKFVTLIARESAKLDQVTLPGGQTLRLIDVESFSEDNLVKDLDDMKGVLTPMEKDDRDTMVEFSEEILKKLGFPGSDRVRAMKLVKDYLNAQDLVAQGRVPSNGWRTEINATWTALVKDVATRVPNVDCDDFIEKVDRMPFAFTKVDDKIMLIFPGWNELGGDCCKVKVIANPKRDVVTELAEAIVIERP